MKHYTGVAWEVSLAVPANLECSRTFILLETTPREVPAARLFGWSPSLSAVRILGFYVRIIRYITPPVEHVMENYMEAGNIVV